MMTEGHSHSQKFSPLFKVFLRCSVTTCENKPVSADLGLENFNGEGTLVNKSVYKITCIKLPFKFLSNEQDKVRSKGSPRKLISRK